MAVVRYVKQYKHHSRGQLQKRKPRYTFSRAWFSHVIPMLFMGIGLLLLANVLVPLASYEIFTAPSLRVGATEGQTLEQSIARPIVTAKEYLFPTPKPTPRIIAQELDYTDLTNWFPESTLPLMAPEEAHTYKISIPSVQIFDAEVVVGGRNLDQHLIQYPGTALPGDYGAPVIFGHSVLRQFYNPKITNPRRYYSIFSTIMTLKNGDEIILTDDNVTYTYIVSNKTEVKPDDRFILEQQRNSQQLKLVTCVPEGTYLRRGVVTALLKTVDK